MKLRGENLFKIKEKAKAKVKSNLSDG